MNDLRLISTLELSEKYIIGFSLSLFRSKKYVSITKFLLSDLNEPEPIGGLNLEIDNFKEMVKIMENHLEELLDPSDKEIAVLQLHSGEDLRIAVTTYNNKAGIDIRKYINTNGKKIPTRKGVRIPVDEADSLDDCLQKLSKELT